MESNIYGCIYLQIASVAASEIGKAIRWLLHLAIVTTPPTDESFALGQLRLSTASYQDFKIPKFTAPKA